jgi:phosphatidylglycerophosphate synthase
VLSLSNTLRLYAAVFALVFLGVLILATLAVKNRWPLLSGPAGALGSVPWIGPWVRKKESLIFSVEEKLLQFHRERPSAFWGSVALNFVCHALAITEVYLILLFMGINVTWTRALILEAFTKLINVAGALTPGNVGVYEGGIMLIAALFGLSGSVGLTLGLCRRVRSLFWTLVGVLSFFVVSRSAGQRNKAAVSGPAREDSPPPLKESRSKSTCESCPETTAAIIFAGAYHDTRDFTPELSHVGTLPIILRAILQAQSVNASRIIVASSGLTGRVIRRELLRTRRLPNKVEWFELDGSRGLLAGLLGRVAADADRILLVSGCAAYHPSLLEMVRQWDCQGEAMALTTGSQFVGIAALSRQGALDIAIDCPLYVETPVELYASLNRRHSVLLKPVQEHMWQSVTAPDDRVLAERKLDGWLVKATDGLFARMNRRISIPISRQLIKFPITPNMVTLFTLGVSFLSGVFFALGGYWSILIGALLSVWASILDGCDGEVARLKLQASKFGCWLETICDYLYYLFIFAGMSIGLTKSRGTEAYLVWGGFLLFGALASFLAVSSARHRFASSQPEKFLDLWQKKADKQTTNPLMYLARNTEFIIRRCFLPYALLAFAALNLIRFAFIASAVGANVVWIVALYSYYKLSRPSPSVALPAVKRDRRESVTGGVFDVGS